MRAAAPAPLHCASYRKGEATDRDRGEACVEDVHRTERWFKTHANNVWVANNFYLRFRVGEIFS